MLYTLAQCKQLIPELNKRALTADDFYRICRSRRLRAKVHEIPLRVPGFYMFSPRIGAHIYINSKLRGVEWLYAAFHELGHHLMHVPPMASVAYFYQRDPNTREDKEAEAFASISVLPEPKFRRTLATPREEWEHGLTEEMVENRLKVLGTYGI